MAKYLHVIILAHLVSCIVSSERKLPWDVNDVAESIFQPSSENSALILTDFTNCAKSYSFLECVKMFLLARVKVIRALMEVHNLTSTDFHLLEGLVTIKYVNKTGSQQKWDHFRGTNLDQKLAEEILGLFQSRSIRINLLNGFGIEVQPKNKSDDDGFVCFSAKTFHDANVDSLDESAEMRTEGKKYKKKKKGGGFQMMPMMIVPQMIMMGFLPFALANLKMMVMNAFMMNSMALNSMIFMTIRNLVFGPKGGPTIKYVNYGYDKNKYKSKRPELILHSPAAFVNRPTFYDTSESHPEEFNVAPHGFEDVSNGPYIRRNNVRVRLPDAPLTVKRIVAKIEGIKRKQQASQTETQVDAQSSYLDANQHIMPSLIPQGHYQSYNNVNLVANKRHSDSLGRA